MIEPLENRRLMSATFYVSPHGNDANAGDAPNNAWKTIQQAMNAATPGSTVLVQPGFYNEKPMVNVSGNATDGFITFQAVGHVTLSGRNRPGRNIISLNNQDFIQIVGFNIQDDLNVTDGAAIDLQGHDDHVNLLNNTIHNIKGSLARGIAAYGVEAFNGISNLIIDGNTIYNCQPANSETVTLNGNVHDFEVANNYIHDVNNIGIDCIGGEHVSGDPTTDFARNGVIRGNRVTRVHYTGTARDGAGIFVDGAQNILVERNTTWRNDVGIEVNAVQSDGVARNVIVRDNNVFNNSGAGISIGASQQIDGTVRNCQVTNNTLFHNGLKSPQDGELRLQFGSGNVIENNLVMGGRNVVLLNGEFGSFDDTCNFNLYFTATGPASAQFAWDGFPYFGLSFFQSAARQDTNSIFANPRLLNPCGAKPRMNAHSPAINAGDSNFVPAAGETDFNGNPRLLGTAVDIGAVEVG
jgi:hypothetical protein